jgi:hypothetical protein
LRIVLRIGRIGGVLVSSSFLVTIDPNDLPAGVRSSLYNQVYETAEVSGAMINAWADQTNSSFILFNTGADLLTDKSGVPELDTSGLPRQRDKCRPTSFGQKVALDGWLAGGPGETLWALVG